VGFTASLHPLSLAGAVRASALRTPQRIAVLEGSRTLTYSDLMAAMQGGRPHATQVVRWLAAEMVHDSGDENPRHRAFLLRGLDNVVAHAAFDRDGTSASSLPLDTEMGAVAAIVSLLLGSTLHIVTPDGLADGICAGRFQTCWLRSDESSWKGLPRPAAAFRLALCVGMPSSALIQWLGPQCVAEAV
jgi:hypothetical protein